MNAQGASLGIKLDANAQVIVTAFQAVIRERLEAQLIAGIRGVGNQFTQENFAVGVQRIDHKLEKLMDFGIKGTGFCRGRLAHVTSPD